MPNIPDYYAAHSPKSVVPNTAISRVAARLLPIMAAFSSLTDRLSNAFKHLKSKGKLSEADIDGTIREIRRALLDADVALDVVRSFTGKVRERALGTEVSDALNPAQQVVKIVNEELTDVLGQGVDRPLNFAKNPPTIIMLAGLQGAGKTTLAGKLGYWLKDSGHTPLLVAADLQRPNAVTQLQVVGERAGVPVYEGMVIGYTASGEDVDVNVCKTKHLTNTRASGSDDALRLIPISKLSLEGCLEFLAPDELLEVTPENLRIRKQILNHEQRMKAKSKLK